MESWKSLAVSSATGRKNSRDANPKGGPETSRDAALRLVRQRMVSKCRSSSPHSVSSRSRGSRPRLAAGWAVHQAAEVGVARQPRSASAVEASEVLCPAAAMGGSSRQHLATLQISTVCPTFSQVADSQFSTVNTGESANGNVLTELVSSLTTLVQTVVRNSLPPVPNVPINVVTVETSVPLASSSNTIVPASELSHVHSVVAPSAAPEALFKEVMPCKVSRLGFHLSFFKGKIWNGEFIDVMPLLPTSKEFNFYHDKKLWLMVQINYTSEASIC